MMKIIQMLLDAFFGNKVQEVAEKRENLMEKKDKHEIEQKIAKAKMEVALAEAKSKKKKSQVAAHIERRLERMRARKERRALRREGRKGKFLGIFKRKKK